MGGEILIVTERLILRETEKDDLADIVRWRNDWDNLCNMYSYLPLSLYKEEKWYENYINDDTKLTLIIVERENNEKIGTVSLGNIDYKNQKAELGILIGDKKHKGRGFGTEAVNSLTEFAFNEMNLHKVYLRVFEDNIAAINLYTKAGFTKDGVLKHDYFMGGRFVNIIIMSKLRE